MTGSRQEPVAATVAATKPETIQDSTAAGLPDERLIAGARRELDRSCAALDGTVLSRLNSIRHAALERKQSRRRHRALLLPFGGLVTACLLVVTVSLFNPGGSVVPQGQNVSTPLEDIELLTDVESLDFYEDYEFYQWLAENGRSI